MGWNLSLSSEPGIPLYFISGGCDRMEGIRGQVRLAFY